MALAAVALLDVVVRGPRRAGTEAPADAGIRAADAARDDRLAIDLVD